ncbi:dihydrodipicolinate synthase family protein [Niabella insulamsoli]|uniref:dihydrodipicolinate synthase family protein n=1 Tax=Niabella insulamsoli TaxID=3144874 RepID=UPI0031FDFC1F
MHAEKKYKGIIIPAVTPLTPDFAIDTAAVEKIFDHFYQHQASPFILGTTGESASLSLQQKKDYVKAAAHAKKSNTVLYAGISSNVVSESIDFANFCGDHGVDAVAATLPSYYALSETQMRQYFEQLAENISIPLIIYNIPATTHMSIPINLIDELSHHPNIMATKDSERSEERLAQSLALWKDRKDFGHFLGWAAKSADALLGGSDGLIPSTGNLLPAIYEKMLGAVAAGDKALAYEIQAQSDLGGSLYQSGRTLGESLWALKVLMKERGLCEPVVMPPLQAQGKEQEEALMQSLKESKLG